MKDVLEYTQLTARALLTTRDLAGHTQQYMARKLSKSVGTIQNWENEIGAPSLPLILKWFELCGVDPEKYLMFIYDPGKYHLLYEAKSDEDIDAALRMYLDAEIPKHKKMLHYIIFGDHISHWIPKLHLFTAHSHIPLLDRVAAASIVMESYRMRRARDELTGSDDSLPDENIVQKAVDSGRESVYVKKENY